MKSEKTTNKSFKAATKNMSIRLKDVDRSTLDNVLEETLVSTEPLSELLGHDGYKRYHAITRSGSQIIKDGDPKPFLKKDEVVTITGDRYKLVQHKEVINNVTKTLDDHGINFTVPKLYVDQTKGSNKIYANIVLSDVSVDIDGSEMSPTIDVYNSTDGSMAAGILFGAYRFKCENGMLVGNTFSMNKLLHTPSIIDQLNFGRIFDDVLIEFNELSQSIERMQSVKFETTMLATLKKMGFAPAFIKYYPTIVERYLLDNSEDISKETAWGLYSAATNFISNYLMLKSYPYAIKQQILLNKFKTGILA